MEKPEKRFNVLKRFLAMLLGLVVISAGAFWGWTRLARYPAFPDAAETARQARTARGWYVFPNRQSDSAPGAPGFIFYPGGLVAPAAYAPLLERLGRAGILSVMVPMPFDLAVFGIDSALDVIKAYPQIHAWILGGHSLGGAMAAEFIKKHPGLVAGTPDSAKVDSAGTQAGSGKVKGIVFLASYPAKSTILSSLPLKALSIVGSKDGVMFSEFESSMKRLPADARLIRIEGGNHAQFGDYGPQKGDGQALIDRMTQQEIAAQEIVGLAKELSR